MLEVGGGGSVCGVWIEEFQGSTLNSNALQGLNRIGNMVVPNENYVLFESWLMPILDTMLDEQINDVRPLHHAPYTLHTSPCTLHPTPYTLHPTPYTLHPTPYTLHPTLHTLHLQPWVLHPAPYTLHH